MLKIIPKEEKFFDLFVMQAENTLEGARMLKDLFDNYTDLNIKLGRIKKTESHGDGLTHKIIEKLNTTFWKVPTNPAGVKQEDGVAKTILKRTDDDYNLTSRNINLWQ